MGTRRATAREPTSADGRDPSPDAPDGGVDWIAAQEPVPYPRAIRFMDRRAREIRLGEARECVWLLEHPPLYTAGTSADPAEMLTPEALPVYRSGRGGRYTYHGPGQRVAYVMLDLVPRGSDLRRFVWNLEEWAIRALAEFDVRAERRSGRIGVWVDTPQGEAKIAALGVRVRRWVSMHGISVNVDPDLDAFRGIVPCGIREFGVTSLADLGARASLAELDRALRRHFPDTLGRRDPTVRSGRGA